jgi:hypothetical protein
VGGELKGHLTPELLAFYGNGRKSFSCLFPPFCLFHQIRLSDFSALLCTLSLLANQQVPTKTARKNANTLSQNPFDFYIKS